MAVSKQPTIPAETSSAEGLDEEGTSRGEAKWKRFHPFRVVRKIFRRRIKREGTGVSDTSKKSWSTSELQSVQDDTTGKRDITSPLKIGLSVSHDSIFSPENASSNVGSEPLDVPHGSSLTVHHSSINTMFKDELFTRVRARRDSDDDDAGLPHSPCNSPTTVDILSQSLKFQEKSSKSLKTCSVGSLISMGSSENDEDSAIHSSGHSSKMSLLDRRSLDSDGDNDSSQPVPLNHNAAHHKIAIKPKRTYGLPRRRMNQIAAAKVNPLPSTPEVTEDHGKFFQKLDEVEIIKTLAECSVTSSHEISLKQSSDKQISQMTTSVSFTESSTLTSEISSLEKIGAESTVFTKSIECNSKAVKNETSMPSSVSLSEIQNIKNCIVEKERFMGNLVAESSGFSMSKSNESVEISKMPLQNENKSTLVEVGGSHSNKSDLQLLSSSIVKSIETSDSLEPFSTVKDTKPSNLLNDEIHFNVQGLQECENLERSNEKSEVMNNIQSEGHLIKSFTIKSYESFDIQKCIEEKVHCTKENSNEVKISSSADKLNIDNEFVLKPIQRRFSQDNFRENSPSPGLYFGEESLMSSNSVSVDTESNETLVINPSSSKSNLDEMLVTEAHNFAAVEENVSTFEETNLQKKKGISESWVNSVNISSSEKDTTLNSLTFSSSKMSDEVITISVNRKSETSKVSLSSQDTKQASELQKPSVMPKLETSQKLTSKDKHSGNKSTSNLNTSSISSKNSAQKRVSVEIVPFSQRVKERKYQPISYANKETPETKKNPSVTVERKLSDRKVTMRNKDTDKSVNRHSFSGALVSENKKGEIVIEKKSEKVQYPVQIRIHKSSPKPEVGTKTNTSNKASQKISSFKNQQSNSSTQAPKLGQNETKPHKEEETNVIENATKWEVKIQPSSQHSTNMISNLDESIDSASEKTMELKEETLKPALTIDETKESQSHSDIESCSVPNQENNLRGTKENPAATIEEPEPELLRVFARRSIKQKHSDKGKSDEPPSENSKTEVTMKDDPPKEKPENSKINPCDSTVVKISDILKPHAGKHDLKKKSKSFSEKEKAVTRSVSPLREMNLIRRESLTKVTPNPLSNETPHPRQRLASVPDIPLNMPPDFPKDLGSESPTPSTKEENLLRTTASTPSGSANGNLSSITMVKENQDLLNDKEPNAPSWLQLAQQRRELREQRERLLLGGSPNSFMDGSNKPSRSSKVWDMVNNFQKLQMT